MLEICTLTKPPHINALSFTVRPGERLVLSGAGSETLLLLLTGTLLPTEGGIFWEKFDSIDDPHQYARIVGYFASAATFPLFPNNTVREHIAYQIGLMAKNKEQIAAQLGVSKKDITFKDANHQLLSVHCSLLSDKADVAVRHLSLFDRKKLTLALALVGDPQVLLLNDPLGGLEQAEADRFCVLLESHLAGRTVVAYAPDPQSLAFLAPPTQISDLMAMDNGQLTMDNQDGEHGGSLTRNSVNPNCQLSSDTKPYPTPNTSKKSKKRRKQA